MKRPNDIVTRDNQIVGCRGRVMVAVLILAILALLVFGLLSYTLFTGTQQPARRSTAEATPSYCAPCLSDTVRS